MATSEKLKSLHVNSMNYIFINTIIW